MPICNIKLIEKLWYNNCYLKAAIFAFYKNKIKNKGELSV